MDGSKIAAIVLGVITIVIGLSLGGVVVGTAGANEVQTNSYFSFTHSSQAYVAGYRGTIGDGQVIKVSEAPYNISGASDVTIGAAPAACTQVPPRRSNATYINLLFNHTAAGAGSDLANNQACTFDTTLIDVFPGAKAIKDLVPLVYYAVVIGVGVGMMSIGAGGFLGYGPMRQ